MDMEWWGVAATLFSAATFLAVVWQILRFETSNPALEWNLTLELPGAVEEGKQNVLVAFKPSGPIVIHDVEAHEWGAARVGFITERVRMDCESEPLIAAALWIVGQPAYVGFSWLEPSRIRHTPVRHAIRRSLPDGEIELWHWYRVSRPAKWRQGEWKTWKRHQKRRTHVPDMWGLPGNK